jgi:hypothetical protein
MMCYLDDAADIEEVDASPVPPQGNECALE